MAHLQPRLVVRFLMRGGSPIDSVERFPRAGDLDSPIRRNLRDPQRRLFPAEARRRRWPFQLVPVIALAMWDRLPKVWQFQAKPSSRIMTRSKPALPFTNEQRAGLQCDALPRLWGVACRRGRRRPPPSRIEGLEMGRRFAAQMGAPFVDDRVYEIAPFVGERLYPLSCATIPAMSPIPQCSTIWPSARRKMSHEVKWSRFPVGSTP